MHTRSARAGVLSSKSSRHCGGPLLHLIHRLRNALLVGVFFALLLAIPRSLLAQGIPEPSLVMYGTVRSGNVRLNAGHLHWSFQAGGRIVNVSTPLTNINDQFSYVLRVPCETEIAAFLVSSNVLRLVATPISYDRSQVTVVFDGISYPASLVSPAQASVSLASRDRGRIEQVDLTASIPFDDSNGNGIPDYWEDWYFGGFVDPFADPDGDGMHNLSEYKAGTNPTDPNSRFAFIRIIPMPQGGITVEWSSVQDKFYTIQRSADLLAGFTNLATSLPATAPQNTFQDLTAIPPGPYFYRLKVEE